MLQYIINLIVPAFVPTIGSAVAAFLAYEIHKLFAMLRGKINASHNLKAIQAAFDRIEGFADVAVKAAEQTIVDKLKAGGKWNSQEAYDQAFSAAFGMLKDMAKAEIPALVQTGYTATDQILRTFIESAVKKYTNATPTK